MENAVLIFLFIQKFVCDKRRPNEEARETDDKKRWDEFPGQKVAGPNVRERRSGAQEHKRPKYSQRQFFSHHFFQLIPIGIGFLIDGDK